MDEVEFIDIKTWDDMNLKTELLRGIYSYGFENPSEIQKKTIGHIVGKHDIIAQAQSGSGKTGAFSISTLQLIDTTLKQTQAIVIAPTHELARQISTVFQQLGSNMNGLSVKTIIGGTNIQSDTRDLKDNVPHIVVGCAGRIYDMLKRRILDVSNMRILVLDEADEMLSAGFKTQIYNIFQFFHENIQVALFSATMPDEILNITKKFMRNPVTISMKKEELNLECIDQYFVALRDDHYKYNMLKELFSMISVNQCIIYCNSVKRVLDLWSAMSDEGFSVCSIHSAMEKTEREKTLAQFRNGAYRVLISSNLTARGIDIQQVSTVINFDITKCVHTYLHRIGRSGRWGRKGIAINFITRRDIPLIKQIESHYDITINELPLDKKL